MPITPINPARGLHEQEPSVNQLGYMADHSKRLHDILDAQIERTYACAPIRAKREKKDKTYCLTRPDGGTPNGREAILERAIWKQWNSNAFMQNKSRFHDALCRHVQTYQMPLKDKESDAWGEIDLVGVSEDGLPVILELKQENSQDTPLWMLAQGLAYAVAVQRAWNDGCLRNEWEEHVTPLSESFHSASKLSRIPVIGIAPHDYWEKKIGIKGKRSNGKVKESAWEHFKGLCDACSDHGFPVSFLQFTYGEADSDELPTIQNVSPVDLCLIVNRFRIDGNIRG